MIWDEFDPVDRSARPHESLGTEHFHAITEWPLMLLVLKDDPEPRTRDLFLENPK